jgi:thioredoxin-like negative regulator of GroEL
MKRSYIKFILIFIIINVISSFVLCRLQEAPDGSVCFNQCNGHGDCIDYSCHCHVGYIGDDCGTTYVNNNEQIIPILGAGHFNITRKKYTQTIIKNKFILVGFSSINCDKCIVVEAEYEKASSKLLDMKIPFGRVNADDLKNIALENGATELPSLVLFNKQRPLLFKGVHQVENILAFVEKQIGLPYKQLKTVDEVEKFISSRNDEKYIVSTIMVIGFFSEHKDIEEDDYEDFIEVAKELQIKTDIYFGIVTNPKVSKHYKQNKIIDRTPSAMLIGEGDIRKTINLNNLYDEKYGLKGWINNNAIPLVGKLTGNNFQLYEKIALPMLMLFLDLTNEDMTSNPGRIVGGKSGGILNEVLLEELRYVAKEHHDKILFVYLDGNKHTDQMRSLGLYGGKERLPSLAFNTREGLQVPYPEELPINRDTLLQFCADFISGKLRSISDSKEMAKKQLQSSKPMNLKNKAIRKSIKEAPEERRGVSEQFGDGLLGDDAVEVVTLKNFEDVVMNEEKDVVLLLHAQSCESCSHFAVYFKRMAKRFKELDIDSLVIARMDVTNETPPSQYNLLVSQLPILTLLPAGVKHPPWTFYSGIGKIQAMMKWVQKQSAIQFSLPNLPHLTDENVVLYKKQVREREEERDKQRTEEKDAMDDMDRERKEIERKQQKKEKLNEVNSKITNEQNDDLLDEQIDLDFDDEDEDEINDDHDEF